MSGDLAYVDTSAYLKLLFVEDESEALKMLLSDWPQLVSSVQLEIEMHRAAYREEVPEAKCDELLSAVDLLDMPDPIRRSAHRIGKQSLRAGDAVHLATAAGLGSDLGVFFAYDHRLLDSALLEGLPAYAPKPGI